MYFGVSACITTVFRKNTSVCDEYSINAYYVKSKFIINEGYKVIGL